MAIDLRESATIFRALGLAVKSIDGYIETLAWRANRQWEDYANQQLLTSRRDYVNGIQNVEMNEGVASIALVGWLPNKVENGWQGGQERDWMFIGPVVPRGTPGIHRSKDGSLYRSIPFRHATPDTASEAGAPMGHAYEKAMGPVAAKALGAQVYAAVEGFTAGSGERLSPNAGGPLLRPRHVTGIYTGMIRQSRAYEVATQSKYATFRTISTSDKSKRSDKQGGKEEANWTHPGIVARDLASQVMDYVGRVAGQTLSDYLGGAG